MARKSRSQRQQEEIDAMNAALQLDFDTRLHYHQLRLLAVISEVNRLRKELHLWSSNVNVAIEMSDENDHIGIAIDMDQPCWTVIATGTDVHLYRKVLMEFEFELESIKTEINKRNHKDNLVKSAMAKLTDEECEALGVKI